MPLSPVYRVFLFAIAALITTPAAAIACDCAGPSCGAVLEAATLFEGTVESVGPAGADGLVVRFRDVRAVRGAAPTVVATASDVGACGYTFVVGRRYLVDANARSSGRFGVSLCSNTQPIERAYGRLALLAAAPEARRRIFGQLQTAVAATGDRGDGPAIQGASVRLSGPVSGETTTSSNGDFAFVGLSDGTYLVDVVLPAHRRDVLPPPAVTVTLGSFDLCASVDLEAESTARVSGTVVGATGAPAAGVRVELYPWPYNQWAGGRVTAAVSDAVGRYTIERIPPGRYTGGLGIPFPSVDNAIAPVLLRAPDGEVVLGVAPGAALEMPPLVATPAPPVTVTGRVSAPAGMPVDGIELVLHPLDGFAKARTYGGKTAPGGRFELPTHRGVRYRVTAEAAQRVVGETEFVAGDDEIEIVLRAPR